MSARRTVAIQRLFSILEQKYGDPQKLVDNAPLVVAEKLSNDVLETLFEHRACGIRIPNFYSKDACARMADILSSDSGRQNWAVSVGASFDLCPLSSAS